MAAHFSHGLFPDFGVIPDGSHGHAGECNAPGVASRAVTADTVGVQHVSNWTLRIFAPLGTLRLRERLHSEDRQCKCEQD
jgi:hypothetical protein